MYGVDYPLFETPFFYMLPFLHAPFTTTSHHLPPWATICIYERALVNGFDPNARPWNISEAMLADAPRPERPLKRTEDVQTQVLSKVHTDQDGRAKTCLDIAGEMSLEGHDISSTTAWRILKKAGSQKKTPTETESPV